MEKTLSPWKLRKARQVYSLFNASNAFSFALLSGNIITLYALRLGATPTVVGLLSSFTFMAFFFMPVGKRLIRKFSIIGVFGAAWLCRYSVMIPLLPAPFFAARGRVDIALGLMLFAVFSFHASRGVGLIGNNPVLNQLASGSKRGGYLTQVQITSSAINMVVSLALALLLGRKPPLGIYGILMTVGIVVGILGSFFIFKLPEPDSGADEGHTDFFKTSAKAFSDVPFRRFMLVLFLVSFVSSTARAFAAVYCREVYVQGDGTITLYAVFGGLGALLMGLVTRVLVDRVGAKPLYIVYTAVSALSLVPALISPQFVSPVLTMIFLGTFVFSLNFGFAGAEGIAQNYFFGLVEARDMLDLGILYYFFFGLAGATGSLLGGVALDFMELTGFPPMPAYRVFFGSLMLAILLALLLQRNLKRLGAFSLRGALGVIFSFRDLRAITLLNRLDNTRGPVEEAALLEALHDSHSYVGAGELLDRVRSPRLAIRIEALRALEVLPELSPEAETTLLADAEQSPYTTAYISARILGKRGSLRSLGLLRRALDSDDYLLAGEAMVALARLGDEKSLGAVEARVAAASNPRLLIMGVSALELFGRSESLAVLLDLLRREAPPPFLRDETVLAMSGILGILDRFYLPYVRWLQAPSLGTELVMDEIDAILEKHPGAVRELTRRKKRHNAAQGEPELSSPDALKLAVGNFLERSEGAGIARWIHDRPRHRTSVVEPLLAEAALDEDLCCYECFRFLLCFWTGRLLEQELSSVP